MKPVKYYDIGLNLFCRQFPEPERIIEEAWENEVCCILTGTDIIIPHRKQGQFFRLGKPVRSVPSPCTASCHRRCRI